MATLRIGELAARLGTTTKTLRFYERIGLLTVPRRAANGYRLYDDDAVAQVGRVLGLRHLGLSLEEIAELRSAGAEALRPRIAALLDEKIRDLDESLAVLQGQRDDLAARHLALLRTPRSHPASCVCAALLLPCTCAE